MIGLLFAPGERRAFDSVKGSGKVDLFYRLWTMKEALVKAVGSGLSMDTAEFEIPTDMVNGQRAGEFRFRETPAVTWCLEDIGNADFAAAFAHEMIET